MTSPSTTPRCTIESAESRKEVAGKTRERQFSLRGEARVDRRFGTIYDVDFAIVYRHRCYSYRLITAAHVREISPAPRECWRGAKTFSQSHVRTRGQSAPQNGLAERLFRERSVYTPEAFAVHRTAKDNTRKRYHARVRPRVRGGC